MTVRTLIVGYLPKQNISELKPGEAKKERYFQNLINRFDLGEIHFTGRDNYREKLDSVSPFLVMVFEEFVAEEVKSYKKEIFVYVIDDPSSIFHRKKDREKKIKKQLETFKEMEWVIKEIKRVGDKKENILRRVAGFGYKETYEMIQQAIIGDNPDLSKQAWELLTTGKNSELIWMRVNLLVDVWEHCDAKGKEEYLTLAMNDHIENGFVRKMEHEFIDQDGIRYTQYMFIYPDGRDANYIRRIPIATKEMKSGHT